MSQEKPASSVKVHMLGFSKSEFADKKTQSTQTEGTDGLWEGARVVDPPVEFDTLTDLYSENATLQRCIDLTANAVTKHGYKLVADDAESNKEAPQEVKDFFENGNESRPFQEENKSVVIDLLNTGSAAMEIARVANNPKLKPSSFYRMAVKNMRVAKGKKGEFKTGQRFVELDETRGTEKFVWYNAYTAQVENRTKAKGYLESTDDQNDINEVMWFTLANPNSKYYGQSPALSLSRLLLLAQYTEDFNVDQFEHGWLQKFIFVLKRGTIDDEQVEELKSYVEEILNKEKEWNRVPLIEIRGKEDAEFKVEQLNQGNSQDGAYLELMKYVREMIYMAYGVPPILLNIVENANRSNSVEQRETFYEDQVRPIQMLLAYRYTKMIREDFGWKGRFEWNRPDLTNMQEDADVVDKMVRMGVLTLNEGRELLNLPRADLPLADEHLVYTTAGVFPLDAFGDPEAMQATVGNEAAKLLMNLLQSAKIQLLESEKKDRIKKGTDDGDEEPIYPHGVQPTRKGK